MLRPNIHEDDSIFQDESAPKWHPWHQTGGPTPKLFDSVPKSFDLETFDSETFDSYDSYDRGEAGDQQDAGDNSCTY